MIAGKVWVFGDNINTDLMVPSPALYLAPEEQKRFVFQANRPGWVDQVRTGDLVIGGRNFGTGSGRPGARSLRNLGIGCLLAESLNGLFFRNAVNFGFVALECAGISSFAAEGETVAVSLDDWTVRNHATHAVLRIKPVPQPLLALMTQGGVLPYLEQQGLIAPLKPAGSGS